MNERPILYSAPMILARLAKRKTQTRRTTGLAALNDHPYYKDRIGKVEFRDGRWHLWDVDAGASALPRFSFRCPWGGPGDQVWAKETWRALRSLDPVKPSHLPHVAIRYEADGTWSKPTSMKEPGRIRQSIFMMRWMSRDVATLAGVRLQRVQDITEEDAIAEGCEMITDPPRASDGRVVSWPKEQPDPDGQGVTCWDDAVEWYSWLWEEIHGLDTWDRNDWVWALNFR